MSGGNFPRDEACEVGRRSANYVSTCIPRNEPPPAQGFSRVYCVKAVGSGGNNERGGPVTIRSCSYSYRTECKDAINIDGRIISNGCIHSCADGEYCNGSGNKTPSIIFMVLSVILIIAISRK